jgi:hypothetical protein
MFATHWERAPALRAGPAAKIVIAPLQEILVATDFPAQGMILVAKTRAAVRQAHTVVKTAPGTAVLMAGSVARRQAHTNAVSRAFIVATIHIVAPRAGHVRASILRVILAAAHLEQPFAPVPTVCGPVATRPTVSRPVITASAEIAAATRQNAASMGNVKDLYVIIVTH